MSTFETLSRNHAVSADDSCIPIRFGIDTGDERVVFLRSDSAICRSEGFSPRARIQIHIGERNLVALLDVVHGDLLSANEVGVSEAVWHALAPESGERATFSHPPAVESLALLRRKIHGRELDDREFDTVIADMIEHKYSNVELAAFVAACAGDRLSEREAISLTRAMVDAGSRLRWPHDIVVDKHCIGGLPGNRTTPIVVAIVTALGLPMPKTSSRAITSPAGTADTMEMMAPVDLDVLAMQHVVERTGGCVVWGRSVNFSPADDVLIRVERMLDVESEGQLVASVLSKKVAAGATHVVIDIPVGTTAKVRSASAAGALAVLLKEVGAAFGLQVRPLFTDGRAPIGRGIGPALEANDVLSVLRADQHAPQDLRARALQIAAELHKFAGRAQNEHAALLAVTKALDSGAAWRQFTAICEAQGGMRIPGKARYTQPVTSQRTGVIVAVDNRRLAKAAKLAGAPSAPLAGISLDAHLGQAVSRDEPLFTLHAETTGQLAYAMSYVAMHPDIFEVKPA